MFPLDLIQAHEPPLRAMALRALGYCPLFSASNLLDGGGENLSGQFVRSGK
ncbi:hypothetical protein [Thermogemmata fonticola]|jgi:hypothetical protein|uniref:Uncharacterized protein n=1 Tax=Thermogemmata fonticola TaxID=2755323 RepID=A0A7V8VG56_9BACT|nr:hypothetical protein [Thermogemmata fonticola]MBA2227428.1 hypothetical protein [Thermogemmata fonticola]